MAKEQIIQKAEEPKSRNFFTLIWDVIKFITSILFTLVLSLGLAIVIELVGMTFIWSDEGANHSENILKTELGYLNGRNYVGFDNSKSQEDVLKTTDTLYNSIAVRFGLDTMYSWFSEYGQALKNVTIIFFVRLAILKSIFLLYVLSSLWAVNEGLLVRFHRQCTGAIERSSVFHHTKLLLSIIILLPVPFYLTLPMAVHPMLINAPFLLTYMLFVVLLIGFYKKNL